VSSDLSRKHVPALDGVRGIAILLVLVHNLSIREHGSGVAVAAWDALVNAGWVGVQLFFVLSGFLITGILLDDRERPHALRTFYIRRSVRIWPLYYVFLIGYAIVVLPHLGAAASAFIWYVLYLSNWSDIANGALPGIGHFWSLAVEEQFYLTWPWLVTNVRPVVTAWACIALAILALVARIALHERGAGPGWTYEATFSRIDALALGALVAVALREPRWRAWLDKLVTPAVAIAAIGVCGVIAKTHGLDRRQSFVELYAYSLLAVLFAAWIARLVTTSSKSRWLASAPLRAAGRYSYAAYVLHFPLKVGLLYLWDPSRYEIAHPLAVDLAFVVVSSALSFAGAMITAVAIERPFLRLKDRWAPR
jgi:peptidoglycan/LPS O-acetylase OafA/YrhL